MIVEVSFKRNFELPGFQMNKTVIFVKVVKGKDQQMPVR